MLPLEKETIKPKKAEGKPRKSRDLASQKNSKTGAEEKQKNTVRHSKNLEKARSASEVKHAHRQEKRMENPGGLKSVMSLILFDCLVPLCSNQKPHCSGVLSCVYCFYCNKADAKTADHSYIPLRRENIKAGLSNTPTKRFGRMVHQLVLRTSNDLHVPLAFLFWSFGDYFLVFLGQIENKEQKLRQIQGQLSLQVHFR